MFALLRPYHADRADAASEQRFVPTTHLVSKNARRERAARMVFRLGLAWTLTWLMPVLTAEARTPLGTSPASQVGGDYQPIALHPRNPHYFTWRGKPTILITSGEHYGALLNLDFDYVTYFKTLQADGLNHTRTFSGAYREISSSFGITDNPLAPKPNRYACPWLRSDQAGYFDGGNRFDLTKWDSAYFTRLKDFMTEAARRGIVVEMTLFCPMYRDELWQACPMNAANNINGVGQVDREQVYTLNHADLLAVQIALTKKIVGELRDFDNLYYEVCNEPYFGGVTMAWQHRIAETIVEAERDFSAKHLISMNIANGSRRVEDPHPAVSIFNFHYCTPPQAVADNFDLNRVIGENETGFRGPADVLYRTEAWEFLIAGGGLYNNLDYSFTYKHPDGTFLDYKSPGGGSPALRRQLRILKDFLYAFDFVRMKPDNTVIQSVSGGARARVLGQRGAAYAVYVHMPIPKKPKQKELDQLADRSKPVELVVQLPAGTYDATWVNTKTGEVGDSDAFAHAGGKRRLASPPFTEDIALKIVAAESSP